MFAPTSLTCELCSTTSLLSYLFLTVIVSVAAYYGYQVYAGGPPKIPPRFRKIVAIIQKIDKSAVRVIFATYQIVQSISWSMGIKFPSVMSGFLGTLSVFSFDFLSPQCFSSTSSYFTVTYLWSIVPIVLIILNGVAYLFRAFFLAAKKTLTRSSSLETNENDRGDAVSKGSKNEHSSLLRQHAGFFLLFTFCVLPVVSRKQFQAYDCMPVAATSVLRADTMVACTSAAYQGFRVIVGLFMSLFLGVPLLWFALLWQKRHKLHPNFEDLTYVQYLRAHDASLDPTRFLFEVYKPEFFYWEVIEIYRRICFIGIIPLSSVYPSRRAAFGVVMALMSIIVYRELEPFHIVSTNILVHVRNDAPLFVYLLSNSRAL